jgi:hypothetical protein
VVEYIVSVIIAAILGYVILDLGVWTAADGKLMIAFAALIPLTAYQYDYVKWMPFASFLINTFLLTLIYSFATLLKGSRPVDILGTTKDFIIEAFHPAALWRSLISLLTVIWAIELFLSIIGVDAHYIMRLIIMLPLLYLFEKHIARNYPYLVYSVIILRILLDRGLFTMQSLYQILLLLFIWRLTMGFIRRTSISLVQRSYARQVPISELKPGDVIRESVCVTEKLTKDEQAMVNASSEMRAIKKGRRTYIVGPREMLLHKEYCYSLPEGITEEDIRKLEHIGLDAVHVSKTMPFAPILFLGVLLTLIFKGNILISLMIISGG